jgi:hypothetical protein
MKQATITVRIAWWLKPMIWAMAAWQTIGLPLTDRTIDRIARKALRLQRKH